MTKHILFYHNAPIFAHAFQNSFHLLKEN